MISTTTTPAIAANPSPVAALTPDKILQTGLAFWPAKTLLTAVSMNVFGTIAAAGGSVAGVALREQLGLHARGARDFFDTLVALGFLERDDVDGDPDRRRYRNTPETDLFLDPAKPSYVGGILEMCDLRLFGYWNRLGDALRTGQPQNEARDGDPDVFAKLYSDPDRLDAFLRAMTGISRGANLAIATQFDWSGYSTFADVGTAQGDLALQIAKANPHLTGFGFDLPAVGPIFDRYVAQNGLSDRLRFVAGDFFSEQPLPSVDVITMGHILHDWDLPQKRALIAKAHGALPKGGALIAYDALIDDARRTNAFGLMMSLNMLIETPGGFDYTGADACIWFREAGFREVRVQHLVGPDSMVIGIK